MVRIPWRAQSIRLVVEFAFGNELWHICGEGFSSLSERLEGVVKFAGL